MTTVVEDWRRKFADDPSTDKIGYFRKWDALNAALRALSDSQLIVEYESVVRGGRGFDGDDGTVWGNLLEAFAARALDNYAVNLMAISFPRNIALRETEGVLAEFGRPAPELLSRAFDKTMSVDNKECIIEALTCAFPELREKISDDREFVSACRGWYTKNRASVLFDEEYLDPTRTPSRPLYRLKE